MTTPDVRAWITPPSEQGQTVERAYGQDVDGYCWERTTSHATGAASCRCLGHATSQRNAVWQPWDSVPSMAGDATPEKWPS